MLSKKPTKTIFLSQLPHQERQEYIKFLLNHKIHFTKDTKGDYVALIRVINPENSISSENKEKSNSQSIKENKINNNSKSSKHSDCSPDNRNTIPKQSNLSSQRIHDYKETFSKYKKFYNEVKPLIGIRGKKCTLYQLKYQIEEIYSIKFIQDSNNLKLQLINQKKINLNHPFPIFLYDYFVNKYVKKQIIDQQALNLLLSVEFFKETNKDIEIFSKLLSEEYDNDDLVFFLFVRSCIEKETGIMFLEKAQDEINLQHMEDKDFIDTEIYLNNRLCTNIANTIFGSDEPVLIKSFMNKVEKKVVSEKNGINASVLLAMTLEDYHESRKFSEEKSSSMSKDNNGEEKEEQSEEIIKEESNNQIVPQSEVENNEEEEEEEDFYTSLIEFYYQEGIKNKIPKKEILQGILNTYLQEKEINLFFEKVFTYDTEDPKVEAKLTQIKALIIRKVTYLISLLFNEDKKGWFVSLKITQDIQKATAHYQNLLKILNQILSYKTIKEISEELIEEFCQNILTTNELMAQIMKLIEKNF